VSRLQLRIYDVVPSKMDEFVEVFAQVVEARARFGFAVEGAWVTEERDQFVWIARYDGPDSFEEASRRYYESDARKAIVPDPASFLTRVETRMLVPVD